MQHVLVTGGAGFIGSNFVDLLLAETGAQVVVLDRLTYAGHVESLEEALASSRCRLVEGDIADVALLDALFEREPYAEAEQAFLAAEPTLKAFYSVAFALPTLIGNNHVLRDGVARAKVATGDVDGAIRIYRDLITVGISSKYNAFLDPRYVLRLAELLDEAGELDEAREQYLRFADLWRDADSRFQPMVERARDRAARSGDADGQ